MLQIKNIIFSLIALLSVLFLHSCQQAPHWESGMFSEDGKYYAYTYSVVTITSKQTRGGASSSQGSIKNYLQVINLATGKTMLQEPYRSKGMLWLRDIENDLIWLYNLNISDGVATPVLYDIPAQKVRFNAEDLIEINPAIFAKSISRFYKDTVGGTVYVEAADGRKYRIDPATGKASVATGNFVPIQDKNYYSYQTKSSMDGYSTIGDTRQSIIKTGRGNSGVKSNDDFINPQFLVINKWELTDDRPATEYNQAFFIISNNSTTDAREKQLTLLDKNTLQTKWSTALPQEEQSMNYEKERFLLKGNQLYVANATNLLVIDADKGNIVQNYSLFKPK